MKLAFFSLRPSLKPKTAPRASRLVLFGSLAAAGCNMTELAVDTQADVMELASPVIEEQTDYEFARYAIPGSLIQVEGLLRVSPENEQLLLLASKGWGSYAYGFVEDEMQRAELSGDLDEADSARARARAMYIKAKNLGLTLLEQRASDLPGAMERDPDELRKFLAAEFTDEEDAAALFWTGYAWGSAINISRDDPMMIADLAFPRVLVERAVALNEGYYHAAGHVFLGVFHSSLGESIGGNPEKGRQHFERALELTHHQAKVVQVNYAESYAVQKQDRELFVKLLEEVVGAATPETAASPENPELALPNKVAERRAHRLLGQVDNLILPPLPPLDETETPPAELDSAVPASDEATPETETQPAASPPAASPPVSPAGSAPAPSSTQPRQSPPGTVPPKAAPAGKPKPAAPAGASPQRPTSHQPASSG